MSTYRDYWWLRQYLDTSLASGYSVAVITNCTQAEVLSLLHAGDTHFEALGIAEVADTEIELAEQYRSSEGSPEVVAVTAADSESTLLIQLNGGSFAITEESMRPLLAGHDVVSHYRSVNADSRFLWWSNGDLLADFDPLLPEFSSSRLDQTRVQGLIREVGGIRIEEVSPDELSDHRAVEGSFALAERITGVGVTAALLDTASFTVAAVFGEESPSRDRSPAPRLQGSHSAWSEVARRYAGARFALHGVITKTRLRGIRAGSWQLEFWFKPRNCVRLSDDQGVLFLQNRHKKTWFRMENVLERRDGGYSLDIHLQQLLQIHLLWPDTPFVELLPADTSGRAVVVHGRPAWEFVMPPSWAGLDATVAFDAATGIPLRWENALLIHEISGLEVGVDISDAFFTGP